MIERRQTNQRQWVYDAIKGRGHLSAQKILEQIRIQHPEISVATVYRNLNILVENDLVQVVGHSSQMEIYDARTDAHAHFVCRNCGKIFDVEEVPDGRAISSLERAGHHVFETRLTLFGQCSECSQTIESERTSR